MLKIGIVEKDEKTKKLLQDHIAGIEDAAVSGIFSDVAEVVENNFDILIFDISKNDFEQTLSKIQLLKEKDKNLDLIAISFDLDSELISKITQSGIKEFILKPVLKGILEAAIQKIKKTKVPLSSSSKALCVYSPKGGSGKTTLAMHLAYELSRTCPNEKVCLLDLTFSQGDINSYLNIKPEFAMRSVLAKVEVLNKDIFLSLIPKYENSNLYVLSNNGLSFKFDPVQVIKTINSLKNIFSYIVIDTASSIDETIVSILNCSDLVLLLSTTGMISLKNCTNSIALFNEIGYDSNKIKLIINRYTQNSDIAIKDIEKTIDKEVFFTLPNNYLTLLDAVNLHKLVLQTNPQSNIARAYGNLTSEILKTDFSKIQSSEYKIEHGIFNLLKRIGE